jgi:hypothetical protein
LDGDNNATPHGDRRPAAGDALRECDRPEPCGRFLVRDAQIERLLKLGATRAEDWPYPAEHDFVVLRDPDGNEFCVITAPAH